MELVRGGRAFVAGVVGGAVMSVGMAIAREIFHVPMRLEMILGTLTGLGPGRGTFAIGLVMHLVLSGVVAMIYALAFEQVTHRAGALVGALLSIPHLVVDGLVLGAMPTFHPQVPERLVAPGPFMAWLGEGAVLYFVVAHAAFGALVGLVYGPVLHPVLRRIELPAYRRRTV